MLKITPILEPNILSVSFFFPCPFLFQVSTSPLLYIFLPLALYPCLTPPHLLSYTHTPSKLPVLGLLFSLILFLHQLAKKSIIKGLLSAWGLPSQSTACAVQLCGKLGVLWMSVSLTRCAVSPFSRYFLSKLWFWCIQHALLIMQYSIRVVSIIKIEMPSDICCIPAINVV